MWVHHLGSIVMVVMHKGQISRMVPGNAMLETFGAICYTGLQNFSHAKCFMSCDSPV